MSTTKQTTSRGTRSKAKAKKSTSAPSGRKAGGAGKAQAPGPGAIGMDERQQMIQVAAYWKARDRGFQPGHEMDDWLAAEQEVDRTLAHP